MSKDWQPAESELCAGVDGLTVADVHADTAAVAAKPHERFSRVRPLAPPLVNSSTYVVDGVDHYLDILKHGGYIYSRISNPTTEGAEAAVRDLEGGAGTLAFTSGMAAITTALTCFLSAGDHVIACKSMFSATVGFLQKTLAKRFGVEISWVPTGKTIEEYEKCIRPNTKLLYSETPCNPLVSVIDLEEFGKLGQRTGIMTMVDGTYASPYLQQPIKYGIDISMHSGTKYLGGHSDLLAGLLTTRTQEQWTKLSMYRATLGNALAPFDAMLLLRGIKTLPLRMERHSQNAQKCAEFLDAHPKVAKVYFPGLKADPGHEVAKKQMKYFSGMIAFEMKGGLEAGKTMIQSVRLIQLAVSLGGAESLIEHPASMTHGPMVMDDAERAEALITPGLIRLSVGLEHPDDLIADLTYSLYKV